MKKTVLISLGVLACCVLAYMGYLLHAPKELVFESEERTVPIKHLVIHSFNETPQEMLDVLQKYGLSVHYMIDAKGHVRQLVPENRIAWHAGPSFWAGTKGLNRSSIGIELEHAEFGQTPFPEKQIDSLIQLVRGILNRHHILPENIVAHSDIAPEGKMDPGRGFPWKRLSEQGIGLWYNMADTGKIAENLTVAELLSMIGYPTEGRQLTASAWAFRQRFMPEVVPYDGEIQQRGEKIFQARQAVANLPAVEQAKALAEVPPIYPPDDGTYLTDPDFIRVLRAVAYRYQQQRLSHQ